MSQSVHLYVDADACPVKAETVKVAERHGLPVVFVANSYLAVPRAPRVRVQVVSGSFGAAGDWIVEQLRGDDVVVTKDIPLASRCLNVQIPLHAGPPFPAKPARVGATRQPDTASGSGCYLGGSTVALEMYVRKVDQY